MCGRDLNKITKREPHPLPVVSTRSSVLRQLPGAKPVQDRLERGAHAISSMCPGRDQMEDHGHFELEYEFCCSA